MSVMDEIAKMLTRHFCDPTADAIFRNLGLLGSFQFTLPDLHFEV
jgi:hypothetical protein